MFGLFGKQSHSGDQEDMENRVCDAYYDLIEDIIDISAAPNVLKGDNYNPVDVYTVGTTFIIIMIAAILDKNRSSNFDDCIDILESKHKKGSRSELFWNAFRVFEDSLSEYLEGKYPGQVGRNCDDKVDAMLKEYSIIMGSTVSTSNKLMKIGESFIFNCGIKKVNDSLLDVIEDFIVYCRFYPDELAIADQGIRSLFGKYPHPYTGELIATAQDYIDAVDSQASGQNIVTEDELSFEEINRLYAKRYAQSTNPATGKPISGVMDFIKAYRYQTRNN